MPSSEAPHNTCVLLTSIHSIQFLLFILPIFLQVIKVVEVNQFDILNGSPMGCFVWILGRILI